MFQFLSSKIKQYSKIFRDTKEAEIRRTAVQGQHGQ
jgi:hypothetical protein